MDEYDVSEVAEIMNSYIFPDHTYEKNDKGELEFKRTNWKDFDSDKKKLYNAELSESVRLLQDIFLNVLNVYTIKLEVMESLKKKEVKNRKNNVLNEHPL